MNAIAPIFCACIILVCGCRAEEYAVVYAEKCATTGAYLYCAEQFSTGAGKCFTDTTPYRLGDVIPYKIVKRKCTK